ncbi:MAG TPA: cyclic nucleotide-binding domain-containing protein [Polyangiaceae bacterium]|jgi:tetratricopeptide (TPR) repeat protein
MARGIGGEHAEGELEFELVEETGDGRRRRYITADDACRLAVELLGRNDADGAGSILAQSPARVADLLVEVAPALPPVTRAALAELFLRRGDLERTGLMATTFDDPVRAASLFERSGAFANAAVYYEHAGIFERAAEMYERADQAERAVRLYAKARRPDRAAVALERMGRLADAGLAWMNAQNLERAMAVLQRVDRAHPDFAHASRVLGRILEDQGQAQAAAARYLEVVKMCALDKTTVDVFERLAMMYVAAGNAKSARKLLSAVIAFDPRRESALRALAGLDAGSGTSREPPSSRRMAPAAAAAPAPSLQAAPARAPLPGAAASHLAPLVLPPLPGAASPAPPLAIPGPPSKGAPPLQMATAPLIRISPEPAAAAPREPPPLVAPQPEKKPTPKELDEPFLADVLPTSPAVVIPARADDAPARPPVVLRPQDFVTLQQVNLFAELSADELNALCAIGENATYAPEELLIEQSRESKRMMVVLEGTVIVSRVEGAGEKVLAELSAGAPLGELAVVDEGTAPAQVRAKSEVMVFRWSLDKIRAHLAANERVALRVYRAMIKTLSLRLRKRGGRK